MKKLSLVGLLMLVVSALSALSASSAFALTFEKAEWLKAGKAITANESTVTEGELLFENVLNKAAMLCSGIFEGTVGAGGVDSINVVLTLTGGAVQSLDEATLGNGIPCTAESPQQTCESGEAWPVELPFKTELELDVETGVAYDLTEADYSIICVTFGIEVHELCESLAGHGGAVAAELVNGATDVEAPVGSIGEPFGLCNGNVEEGKIVSEGSLTSLLSGEALSISK